MARVLLFGVTLTAAYVASATLGFEVAFVAEQVTTVWAPTGIALAGLVLGGLRMWPAVWLGALLANLGTGAPVWTAPIIAAGNTLEVVAAVWWLRRRALLDPSFSRTASAAAFILVAAGTSTAISATIGVATLCAAGVQPWSRFAELWFDWWLGDATGAAVVAPPVILAFTHAWSKAEGVRVACWVAAALLLAQLVFGRLLGTNTHPLEFAVFPLTIAAALVGGPAVASWVVLSASTVAIWHTVGSSGPFAGAGAHERLVLLQVFVGVLSVTSVLLAASAAERLAAERREKDAAASLRRRQELLHLAQRAGGVATFEWDFENQVAECSAEFFALFGLPREDGVMTSAQWGEFVHPDDRARMAAHLDRVVAGEEPAVADYRITAADGVTRWLSYAGQIQRTGAGLRLLGTVVDVTNRKRAELALQEAKQAAESANQLKDQFLATLSHELRTPLNAILGYASMLQTDAIVPEKRQKAIDVIQRNAVAQNQLVEDLLDMSRIATGRVRIDPRPLPVDRVLRDAIDGIRPAADAKRIGVHAGFDAHAGTVRADATRLQQIFWNVLTNAVKFTDEGGQIQVQLRRSETKVEIAVVDTGAGISPDFMPYVFEPFRQGENRLHRTQGGLGLGLAITKQLVELHGGTIKAASPGPGHGATFTIALPSIEGLDAAATAEPRAGGTI